MDISCRRVLAAGAGVTAAALHSGKLSSTAGAAVRARRLLDQEAVIA
jgi:hypothetical protein